ncbi:hypothetical protein Tcan_04345 [Toxocara canis]|uniref:Cytochrome b-c1 complex subunit 10 n=1 Tax=Toxocara canis TaxID=6265 RepID=A0A0B2VNS2_TOXCA|nr:hypothetical protein Tcan_04345 [Toxocara canis]
MIYMRPLAFFKRALTNNAYYPTYAAYGSAAFLAAIYFCEWKTVGQFIPIWNARYVTNEEAK